MRRSLIFASLFIMGLTIGAHATSITAGVYNLDNATVDGYSITGTVTLNSSGQATSAALTLDNPNFDDPGLPFFNQISTSSAYNGLSQNYISSTSNIGQIALNFDITSDANGNFDLCINGAQCGTSTGTVDPAQLQIYGFYNGATGTSNPGLASTALSSGYLASTVNSAAASTPEPASLALLGTGLLVLAGVGGLARIKFFGT